MATEIQRFHHSFEPVTKLCSAFEIQFHQVDFKKSKLS